MLIVPGADLIVTLNPVHLFYDTVLPGSSSTHLKHEKRSVVFQMVQLCNRIWHHSSAFSWRHEAADATLDDYCHFKRVVAGFH